MLDRGTLVDALLDWMSRNLRLLGIIAVLICVITWWIDLSGLVYECVYCRTQRTAIGLVGLIMMLPNPRQWFVRFVAVGICFLGADIAVDQLFLVIRNINAGKPFGVLNLVMATGALFTLVGQTMLLFLKNPRQT